MSEEEFKQYLDKVSETEWFKKLDKFIKVSKMPGNSIFEKVKYYLSNYHPKPGGKTLSERFRPDYDHFYNFFEAYQKKDACIKRNNEGFFDMSETLHLVQPPMYAKSTGVFTDNYFILPDDTIYISKYPLFYKGVSGVEDTDCLYCAPIATGIAKFLDVSTSENILARKNGGQLRLLSKYFLNPNEEMITIAKDVWSRRISNILDALEEELDLRKYSKQEIEKVKLEFLKQEFVAKIIGLKDQHEDNAGLIQGLYGGGKRTIKMAPLFDYDYSFHIAQDLNLQVRQCDNGKTDIASLIEQYKDNPEFMDFVQKSISSFDMGKVYQQLYQDTGHEIFKNYRTDNTLLKFTKFVNKNVKLAKQKLEQIYSNEREEK